MRDKYLDFVDGDVRGETTLEMCLIKLGIADGCECLQVERPFGSDLVS